MSGGARPLHPARRDGPQPEGAPVSGRSVAPGYAVSR